MALDSLPTCLQPSANIPGQTGPGPEQTAAASKSGTIPILASIFSSLSHIARRAVAVGG